MQTLRWDPASGSQARTHFRNNPLTSVLFAENSPLPYQQVLVLPHGSALPTELSVNTLAVTKDRDSDDEMTVGFPTSTAILKSPTRQKKIKGAKKILEESGLSDSPTAESGGSYSSLSKENMEALVTACKLKPTIDTNTYFTGAYIKTEDHKIYFIGPNIGAGSRSKVHLAIDEYGTYFAFKFSIRSSEEKDNGQSARNEAKFYRKLNMLSSPAMQYNDTKNNLLVFITPMHFISDKTLSKYLEEHPECSLDKRYELAIKLCFLIEKLHNKGIAHGDIKPENIMIDNNDNLHLIDFECATKAIDAIEDYESTSIYMLPKETLLSRRQSDMIALMRTLFKDDCFLTANEHAAIYTLDQRESTIFKSNSSEITTHIVEKIKPLLSTKFLKDDNTTLFSPKEIKDKPLLSKRCIDLAYALAFTSLRPTRALTLAALEFEKLHLAPTSYAFQYATTEHTQQFLESNPYDILALKQALRIMSHQYSHFTKENIIRDNLFFNSAITFESIESSELHHILHDKKPSGICTHSALYREYQKRNAPTAQEIEAQLLKIGMLSK